MYKFMILVFLSAILNATMFSLQTGEIKAHTEIFGDSGIDPKTTIISSNLMMEEGVESLKGTISFKTFSLKSEKEDRDEHMHESMNSELHKSVSFYISRVKKLENDYEISGFVVLNGVKKEIKSVATITENTDTLKISGTFSIIMSDFSIEPPTLLFLSVRDQVDITYNLNYKDK